MTGPSTQAADTARTIVARTRGSGHGGITRLMSPSDLGQQLKPFVFLDLFDADATFAGAMPIHPHSGIATVTVLTEGDVRFDDPDSGTGTIGYGGVEWMRASGGVWHGQEMAKGASPRIRGFQLWLALPPELENGPVDSQYVESDRIPRAGPARVVLGSYDGAQSPVRAPSGINYLLVTLKTGESWTYTPPPGHEVAFVAVSRGQLLTPRPVTEAELAVFGHGTQALIFAAGDGHPAVFVLGSAVPHPHDLALGNYSVHTSNAALALGESRIAELRHHLHRAGHRAQSSGATPIFR